MKPRTTISSIAQVYVLCLLFFGRLNPARSLLQSPTVSHRGTNRLFLDTADTDVWQELLPLGIFHGVTTNPTLLERADEECTTKHLHHLAPHCHSPKTIISPLSLSHPLIVESMLENQSPQPTSDYWCHREHSLSRSCESV